MADAKISALTALLGADVADGDLFAIVDVSASATKKITRAEVLAALSLSGTNTGDQTSVSGNAGTATALATGRTIAITGDLAYTSPSFSGAGNVTAVGTLATVNSNVGSFGSTTQSLSATVNAKGLVTAMSAQTVTPAVGSITGLGTGIATALAVNVGSAGAPVVLGGALGTPSSGSLANCTFPSTVAVVLVPTAVKTSGYTAAANDFVPVDTTSGSVTITLPTAPADGTQIGVKQITRGGTNTVTVTLGGSDVFNKSGGGTTATLTLSGAAQIYQYKATGAIWYVTADDQPYGSLIANAQTWSAVQTFVAPVLGTPGSGNLSNCTALPVGSVTGFGTGIATWLATPSSANLAAALTDETGSGSAVFATSPTLVTPVLGVASATTLNIGTTATPGTPGAPALTFGTTTNCGFYRDADVGSNFLGYSSGGLAVWRATAGEFQLVGNGILEWGNQVNTFASSTADTFIKRAATATIQQGAANAASPIAQTLQAQGSRSGTDSNVGGANYSIGSGIGTGTGTLSVLNLQSPAAVASGTGAQTQTTGLQIKGGTAVLTSYTVANLPTGMPAGATAFVTDASTTLVLGLGGTVSGSGSNKVPVYFDGSNWVYG